MHVFMTKIYIKRKRINEDDTANNGTDNSQQTQNQQSQQTTQQTQQTANKENPAIEGLKQKGSTLLTQYNTLVNQLNVIKKQITMINAQLLALGASAAVTLPESYGGASIPTLPELRFKKQLFENRSGDSQVEEIAALFLIAFQRANASKMPSRSDVLTYARNTKNFIFKSGWARELSPKDHWAELSDMIREKFEHSRGNVNVSKRELDIIMDNIKDLLKKSSTFSWIFGNESDNDINKENL
jgi:hypothetical protein